jgi:hypothetical protein
MLAATRGLGVNTFWLGNGTVSKIQQDSAYTKKSPMLHMIAKS